jgi:hypothetical protein
MVIYTLIALMAGTLSLGLGVLAGLMARLCAPTLAIRQRDHKMMRSCIDCCLTFGGLPLP